MPFFSIWTLRSSKLGNLCRSRDAHSLGDASDTSFWTFGSSSDTSQSHSESSSAPARRHYRYGFSEKPTKRKHPEEIDLEEQEAYEQEYSQPTVSFTARKKIRGWDQKAAKAQIVGQQLDSIWESGTGSDYDNGNGTQESSTSAQSGGKDTMEPAAQVASETNNQLEVAAADPTPSAPYILDRVIIGISRDQSPNKHSWTCWIMSTVCLVLCLGLVLGSYFVYDSFLQSDEDDSIDAIGLPPSLALATATPTVPFTMAPSAAPTFNLAVRRDDPSAEYFVHTSPDKRVQVTILPQSMLYRITHNLVNVGDACDYAWMSQAALVAWSTISSEKVQLASMDGTDSILVQCQEQLVTKKYVHLFVGAEAFIGAPVPDNFNLKEVSTRCP